METTTLKIAAIALLSLIVLSNVATAEFTMTSLSVFININRDGSANVEESLNMVITGTPDRELYEATRAAYSDLSTWQNRTGLSEMRHHISRANADIANLRVIPQSLQNCNSFMGTCLATVVLDYQVVAGQNGSGLVKVDRYKPRTAKYSLLQDALSFEQTKTGDLVLPAGTNISIAIPQAADKIYFSSVPQNLQDATDTFRYDQGDNVRYYTGPKRVFNWQGDALSKFQFTYEIESPLESEVIDFFANSQNAVMGFFLGPEGMAAVILILVAAASVYSFNRINR
jgi:hypothetical protein